MKMFPVVSGLVLAVGLAGAATADTYNCKMTPAGKSHLIPAEVIIQHDPAAGTVTVFDNVIKHYVGNPISGSVKSKNAKRVLFTWTVQGVKSSSSGQYAAGLTYSLNIQLPSGTASMNGKPQGYSNSWRGSGNCSVQ